MEANLSSCYIELHASLIPFGFKSLTAFPEYSASERHDIQASARGQVSDRIAVSQQQQPEETTTKMAESLKKKKISDSG